MSSHSVLHLQSIFYANAAACPLLEGFRHATCRAGVVLLVTWKGYHVMASQITQALSKETATPGKQLKENLRPAAYNVEAQSLHFTKTNKVLQPSCHESHDICVFSQCHQRRAESQGCYTSGLKEFCRKVRRVAIPCKLV